MIKITDQFIEKMSLPIIAFAAVLLVVGIILSTKNTTNENNAYIRVINCIVSHTSNTGTQNDIEGCYVAVENDSGIKLKRYDGSRIE